MEKAPINKNRIMIVAKIAGENGFMRDAFENAGYKVVSADNGIEGLKIYYETHPDIVILDLDITDMNGADFCRAVTNNNRLGISIIVLSSKTELSLKLASFVAGAKRFIQKPVQIDELLNEVIRLTTSREHDVGEEYL